MSVLSAKSERPRLPIKWLPESALEWLAEAAALGVLLFWVFYLATYWSDLPDEVPKGFGFGGQPRGSASRSFLWLLPGVGIVSYCGLTLLSRLTHLHNFPVEVTAENAAELYAFSRRILTLVKLQLVAAVGFIEWKMIQTARGTADGLGTWFMPLLVAAIFATSLYPLYRLRRNRDNDMT